MMKVNKKLFYMIFAPLLALSYEMDYASICEERQDSDACIKAAIKNRHNITLHIKYLEQSCELSNKEGCYLLSKSYIDYAKDPKLSGQAYLKACTLGHAKACYDIGVMASNLGRELQKNLYLDKSCALGYKPACKFLGK